MATHQTEQGLDEEIKQELIASLNKISASDKVNKSSAWTNGERKRTLEEDRRYDILFARVMKALNNLELV